VAAAKAVYFSGSTGNKPTFRLARANAESTMPAIGMTTAVVDNNQFGEVMIIGRLLHVKTDYPTWTEGQQLYVDPTIAGDLTNIRPTHPNLAQWIATIEVVHANNGVLLINTQSLTGVEDGTNKSSFTVGNLPTQTLVLASGSITNSSGVISFGNNDLTTTGIFTHTQAWTTITGQPGT
jgi:hypothetical protein